MDAGLVAQLARQETKRYLDDRPANDQFECAAAAVRSDADDVIEPEGVDGWVAYWPLGASEPRIGRGESASRIRLEEAIAAGTTLIVRFTWVDSSGATECLLPIDVSEWPGDDLQIAGGRIVELLLGLTSSPGWYERLARPISPRVVVVVDTPS